MGFSVSTKLDIVKNIIENNIDNISGKIDDIDIALQDIFAQTINDPEESKKDFDEIKAKWQEIKESIGAPSKERVNSFKGMVEKTSQRYREIFSLRDLPLDMLNLISSKLSLEDRLELAATSEEMYERTEIKQGLVDFEKAGDFFGAGEEKITKKVEKLVNVIRKAKVMQTKFVEGIKRKRDKLTLRGKIIIAVGVTFAFIAFLGGMGLMFGALAFPEALFLLIMFVGMGLMLSTFFLGPISAVLGGDYLDKSEKSTNLLQKYDDFSIKYDQNTLVESIVYDPDFVYMHDEERGKELINCFFDYLMKFHSISEINRFELFTNLEKILKGERDENAQGRVDAFHNFHNLVRRHLYEHLETSKTDSKKELTLFAERESNLAEMLEGSLLYKAFKF